jgi:hypothetical protein
MALTQEEQDRMLAEYLALQETREVAPADDDSEDGADTTLFEGVLAHSNTSGLLALAGKMNGDEKFAFLSTGPVHWDPYNLTLSKANDESGQTPPPSRMIAMKGTLGSRDVTLTLRLTAEPHLVVIPKPKKPPPGSEPSDGEFFGVTGWGQEQNAGQHFAFQFSGNVARTEKGVVNEEEEVQSTILLKSKISMQVGEDSRKLPAEESASKRPRVEETTKDS